MAQTWLESPIKESPMNKIEFGDCRETMRRWASEGIKAQTCVTSPPYYGLRDYGTAKWEGGNLDCDHTGAKVNPLKVGGFTGERLRKEGGSENEKYLSYKKLCPDCNAVRVDSQIGIEETPEEYIAAMVEVFRCVKDVLADDGTLWVNIGDSYAGSGGAGNQFGQLEKGLTKYKQGGKPQDFGCKPKDLIGIPWMLAFALRSDGWYLRQDIIWHKPNPMPESVQDRCTKAHEYIFLLSKSPKYYYDNEAIKEPVKQDWGTIDRKDGKYHNEGTGLQPHSGLEKSYEMANKRSVWTVNTKPYAGAHFAVFPTELIEPCILAGAAPGQIVLDPFMGSGTTAQVAQTLGRKYLGCELNPDYKALQDKRLAQQSLEFV
jgi:DNA modification methylase